MPQRPNILLITAHDLGTHLGCHGWDPALCTPHLDQLAVEGVRCRNHFCTAPYCSPSRGAMLTGRHPHVNGLMGLVNLGWDLPADEVLLPEALSRAGYRTTLVGLQHLAADPSRLGYDEVGPRGGYGCRKVAPQACEYLCGRESGDEPFYLEVGFSDVHRPYGGLEQRCVDADELTPLPFLRDTPGLRMDLAMLYENIRRLDDAVGQIVRARWTDARSRHC